MASEIIMNHQDKHSLAALKGELRAWAAHVDRLGLDDRRRFIEWLSGSLEPGEFALAIDAEIDRGLGKPHSLGLAAKAVLKIG